MIPINLNEKTKRRKWAWTALNEGRAEDIEQIIDELREYHPLTERQIYYRLISSNLINQWHCCKHGDLKKGQIKQVYDAIGNTLKWMRIDDHISWDVITDEHRILSGKVRFENPDQFITQELSDFLNGYRRCLAHRQEYHVEIWVEKATLYHIVKSIADKYCRYNVCCRGYNSISFQADFYDRASVNMFEAAVQTLTDELGLVNAKYFRCGINPEHFHFIHAKPVPLKQSDKRMKKFIKKYGNDAYELDALHPEQLKELVEESIKAFTDMDAVFEDLDHQDYDLDFLDNIKDEVHEFVLGRLE